MPCSCADEIEHYDCFAGKSRQIDRAIRYGGVAHRGEHGQQVASGGSDIVPITRIIAAKRPVGTLDDPFGGLDDAVQWRPQDLVQCIVEGCVARGRRRCRSAGVNRTTEARETSVRAGNHLAVERNLLPFVRPASGALPGETAPRCQCADQRHLARFIFVKAQHSCQRLSGHIVGRDAQQFRQVRRQGDNAQFFVGCPFVANSTRLRLSAATEDCRKTWAGRRPSCPTFEGQDDLLAVGRGNYPKFDVVIRRCSKRRPGHGRSQLARELGHGRNLRERQGLPERRPGFALKRLELGIGRH